MARTPRDLVVRFVADVVPFLKRTDDVGRALNDTMRDLDDLADAGEDSARRLSRAYDRAGQDIRTGWKRDTSSLKTDAKDTGKEIGNEFASNLGESLASGDSSRIVQDSLGGLVSSLAFAGPLGAAVAAGGAIALGLWNAFAAKTQEQQQAVLDAAATLYEGMISQGADFAKQYADDVVRKFFDPSTADDIVTNARTAAEALGDNLGKVLAGGPDSIAAYAKEAGDRIGELQDKARANPLTGVEADELKRLSDVVYYLDTIKTGWDKATTAVDKYNAALSRSAYYASQASSYRVGGSTYNSQLGAAAPYATGTRG